VIGRDARRPWLVKPSLIVSDVIVIGTG